MWVWVCNVRSSMYTSKDTWHTTENMFRQRQLWCYSWLSTQWHSMTAQIELQRTNFRKHAELESANTAASASLEWAKQILDHTTARHKPLSDSTANLHLITLGAGNADWVVGIQHTHEDHLKKLRAGDVVTHRTSQLFECNGLNRGPKESRRRAWNSVQT